MDRSLMLKASALAKGTRRIDLSILHDDDPDIVDAEFVDLPNQVVPSDVVETLPALIEVSRITPGRARRATNAYAPVTAELRPVIAIG